MLYGLPEPTRHYRNALFFGFGVLLLLSALGTLMMLAALQIQADAQAFNAGESHWFKGMSSATYHLDRYAEFGDSDDLRTTREALAIPLGDLHARLAMDRSPPDLEAAWAGFLAGNNAPRDIPGMIRLYRYLGWTPDFQRAIELWRESDTHVLRLSAIADTLDNMPAVAFGTPETQRLRREIAAIDQAVRPLAEQFSIAMLDGTHRLKRVLSGAAAIMALSFALITCTLFYRLMAWLRRRDRRFHATFEQAGVGMARVDLKGRFLDVNQALCQTLCLERGALLGRDILSITHPADAEEHRQQSRHLLDGHVQSYTIKLRYRCGDDSEIRAKVTVALTRQDDGSPEQFIYIIEDVTESHTLAEKLSHQVSHDDLTGLYNRREIQRRLSLALESAWQDSATHVLCFLDLDQFKIVNDSCGHLAGDELLRRIAALMADQLRETDVLGRLGGDEFAVILCNCRLPRARQVAEKLRSALADLVFRWEDRSFRVTVTIGLVEITERSVDITSLLRAADTACKLAKDQGRDRIHAYIDTDWIITEHHGTLEWPSTLRNALADDRITLAAQRIQPFSPEHAGELHYEVLVRLVDAQGKEHPPGAFLPAAERYRLITEIDQRVVDKALIFLAEHPDELERLSRCHINVSGQSISNPAYRDFVLQAIRRYRIPAEKLCFEITETAAMANLQDARLFFEQLRRLGCCIALDDFGSGLSSFGYLKHFPAEILKIDGTFVRDILHDPHDLAVVRAIHNVGKTLGKLTVAEYVESAEALERIRALGIDFAQGYAIHRPVPIEQIGKSHGVMVRNTPAYSQQ